MKSFLIRLSERFESVRKQASWVGALNETSELGIWETGGSAVGTEIEHHRKVLFNAFEDEELLSQRDMQDFQSTDLDMWNERKHAVASDKEGVIEDVFFEIQLMKQVEINVGYILMLVHEYRDECGDGNDKKLRAAISHATDSSPLLRNKKERIENLVDSVSNKCAVKQEWREFVAAQRDKELAEIITAENLKFDETERFIKTTFRDGILRTTGTAITKVLPTVSQFSRGKNHPEKKQRVISALGDFFDRFSGLSTGKRSL